MRRCPLLVCALAILFAALGPAPMSAQTPTAGTTSPLMSLLRQLPDSLPSNGQIQFANYALQLEAMGIVQPGSALDTAEWLEAVHGTMIPWTFVDPVAPEWREGLGFDLRDVDALVDFRTSDTSITVITGDLDPASLPAVWERAGYTPVVDGDITWYTLGEDHALIFDHPTHRMHLGDLSHLVVLDNDTVVGTTTRAHMEAVIARAGGGGSSFADGRGAVFLQAPEDLAAAYIVDGSTLVPAIDPLALIANNPNVPHDAQERLATQVAQMEEEAPRMPPIYLALIGASAGAVNLEQAAGGADRARSILVIVPLSERATEVVAETVTRRLTTQTVSGHPDFTGQPYSAMFTDMVIETPSERPVVVVELVPAEEVPATVLVSIFEARQLTILAWAA